MAENSDVHFHSQGSAAQKYNADYAAIAASASLNKAGNASNADQSLNAAPWVHKKQGSSLSFYWNKDTKHMVSLYFENVGRGAEVGMTTFFVPVDLQVSS